MPFGQSEFFVKMKKIDSDGTLLWLGFGRGVRVVAGGDQQAELY